MVFKTDYYMLETDLCRQIYLLSKSFVAINLHKIINNHCVKYKPFIKKQKQEFMWQAVRHVNVHLTLAFDSKAVSVI